MLQDTKNELLQNILFAIGAKDSYSINGDINNKIALKRASFKYDIHDTVIALGTGSLTLSKVMFILCIIYIFMYI